LCPAVLGTNKKPSKLDKKNWRTNGTKGKKKAKLGTKVEGLKKGKLKGSRENTEVAYA